MSQALSQGNWGAMEGREQVDIKDRLKGRDWRQGGWEEAGKRVQEVRRKLDLGLWEGRGRNQGAGTQGEGVVSQNEGQGGA